MANSLTGTETILDTSAQHDTPDDGQPRRAHRTHRGRDHGKG